MQFDGLSALIALFIFLAIPATLIGFIIARSSRYAHRKVQLDQNVIIAEYEPPDGLSPAEMGYLFDSRIDKTEVVATLLDLEQRGIVTLSGDSAVGIQITKIQPQTNQALKPHEDFILRTINQQANLTLFDIQNLHRFSYTVKGELIATDYVASSKARVNYLVRRTLLAYICLSVLIFIWFMLTAHADLGGALIVYIVFSVFLFPVFMGLSFIAGFIYNHIVGQQGLWSTKAKQLWPQLEGYREYIRRVELDQIQYDSEEQKTITKNKALPYAVALDLNTEWQKRF